MYALILASLGVFVVSRLVKGRGRRALLKYATPAIVAGLLVGILLPRLEAALLLAGVGVLWCLLILWVARFTGVGDGKEALDPGSSAGVGLTGSTFLLLLALFVLALGRRALTLGCGSHWDPGCFMVMIRSMGEGKVLYKDIFVNLPPLLFYAGRFLHAVAPSHFFETSRLFMILAGSSCVVPLYFVGRRLFGQWAAALACLFYCLDPHSIAYARDLHVSTMEGIVSCWTMGGFVLALSSERHRRGLMVMAGALAGLAFCTKQSSAVLPAVFLLCAGLFSPKLRLEPSWRRPACDLVPFASGFVLALVPWVMVLGVSGALGDAWRSLVGRNFVLRDMARATAGPGGFLPKIDMLGRMVRENPWVWLLAAIGCLDAVRREDQRWFIPFVWFGGYVAFFFLLYFRDSVHYLLPCLPAVALLAGAALARLVGGIAQGARTSRALTLTTGLMVLTCTVAPLTAWRLFEVERISPALLGCGMAGIAFSRCFFETGYEAPGVRRRLTRADQVLALICVLGCLVVTHLQTPRLKRHPRVSLAQEREVAAWVKARLREGEDVHVLVPDMLTIHGGWAELPVSIDGREMISPMLLAGWLRRWSHDGKNLAETLALWERGYRVRFTVIKEAEWRSLVTLPQNLAFRRYVESRFRLVKTFSWPGVSPRESFRIYERVAPFPDAALP